MYLLRRTPSVLALEAFRVQTRVCACDRRRPALQARQCDERWRTWAGEILILQAGCTSMRTLVGMGRRNFDSAG
jgi:hypothetical protein